MTAAERNKFFAWTFKAIGQTMHLVQDASVPSHTRNDAHAFWNYENWVDELRSANTGSFQRLIENPKSFAGTISTIASLIDIDYYNRTNPSTTLAQGLAEYTNANFASDDTIFAEALPTNDAHYFPYPRKTSPNVQKYINANLLPETIIAEDGVSDPTFYIRKSADGEVIEHFAKPRYFTRASLDNVDETRRAYHRYFALDETCHKDYAQLLLPRAVGYSAGLLNYFFRGTLEITQPDRCLYGLIDGSVLPQQFTQLKAKVRNTTPNEPIGNGIIQAVARYKKIIDYHPDLSTYPTTSAGTEPDFSYSVSAQKTLTAEEITALSSATAQEFTFNFTNSPIPAGVTDLYLHVIFKGTLGNETDIAVAVGNKDLSEPMHNVYWNSTDRFYLNGELRTADEIRSNPALSNQPIDPYDLRTEIAFCGQTPQVVYNPMPTGSFGRVITITEASTTEFPLTIHRQSIDPASPQINRTSSFSTTGIVSQGDEFTQLYIFRGINMHAGSAFTNCYPDCAGVFNTDWPGPINSSPVPVTTLTP
jgi:hypothetical protein